MRGAPARLPVPWVPVPLVLSCAVLVLSALADRPGSDRPLSDGDWLAPVSTAPDPREKPPQRSPKPCWAAWPNVESNTCSIILRAATGFPAGTGTPEVSSGARVSSGRRVSLGAGASPGGAEPVARPESEVAAGWIRHLGELAAGPAEVPADERIERIRVYEELKAALAAAQAREAVAFEASRRAEREAAGVPEARRGQGIPSEIALARREAPSIGARLLGLAKVLVNEMPRTLEAVAGGRLSEWRATLVARETACLSLEDRQRVDDELFEDAVGLDRMGNRALVGAVRKLAYRLDPHAVVKRARKAESERTVTCRPAPDTMMYVTALLAGEAGGSGLRRPVPSGGRPARPRRRAQPRPDHGRRIRPTPHRPQARRRGAPRREPGHDGPHAPAG